MVAFLVTSFVPAAAQSPPAQAPSQSSTPVTAGWNDGFVIQSGDGDYRLTLGMVAQIDGRFSVDDPLPITNTFTVRKIRPTFTGRVARYFDFKVMPDFGSGQAVIADAYVDVRFSPAFRVRTGKDKTPVGYELLQGDAFVLFPERSLATGLVPNRDIGVQAQGELAGGRVLYAGGIFNGVADGTSLTTELDTNSDKDAAGRVLVQPFRSALVRPGALSGLGFHLGGSYGNQRGPLPTFRTSVGQAYFSYAAGVAAAGERWRLSPALAYYYRGLGGFAEYMRSTQEVARADTARRIKNQAWQVTGSYVLTGEAASERGVRPRANFDPQNGRWGALQVLARIADVRADGELFAATLAAPGASRTARSWTVAANWYPNPWIKWYATFERTVFDRDTPAARPPENVILFRAQLAF